MPYSKITPLILDQLKQIVGERYVLTAKEAIEPYSHDETEDLVFYPEVVVKPADTGEVSQIMKLATEHHVAVTPRGGGTSLSGGALAVCGGIVLTLERMNKILEIDRENLMVVTEPGVITEILQNEVEKVGLYYPPDPASRGSCQIGGNIAENAGGPHALKYGVTKDYVMGLEAVLPNGEIIHTSGKLMKDVTGYNLTQLLVGSEGTLAIVTKVYLRLIPLPKFRKLLYAPFETLYDAAKALTQIFYHQIIPAACEFMETGAMDIVEARLNTKFPSRGKAQACLLIDLDGSNQDELDRQAESVYEILTKWKALDVVSADTKEKQDAIWRLRRSIGEAVKQLVYKEEDTVVPRSNLPELVMGLKEISKKYGITSVCYGHAGDGNIHANLLKGELSESRWQELSKKAIPEMFELTVKLGGNISGEHGIGFVQKEYLSIGVGKTEISLMRSIKNIFDPQNILNPGKIFPEAPVTPF